MSQPKQNTNSAQNGALASAKKQECLEDYLSYVETERALINSTKIDSLNPALFRRILRCFGSWRIFVKIAEPYVDAVKRR